MKRYIYQDDFKERAVILFRQVGIAKASKVTHVTRATLYRWNKEFGDDLQLPEGKDQWPELSENFEKGHFAPANHAIPKLRK